MLVNFWMNLSPKVREEVRSFLHTFLAGAMGDWALQGFGIPTSKEMLIALAFAMLRAGIKAGLSAVFASSFETPAPPTPPEVLTP